MTEDAMVERRVATYAELAEALASLEHAAAAVTARGPKSSPELRTLWERVKHARTVLHRAQKEPSDD